MSITAMGGAAGGGGGFPAPGVVNSPDEEASRFLVRSAYGIAIYQFQKKFLGPWWKFFFGVQGYRLQTGRW